MVQLLAATLLLTLNGAHIDQTKSFKCQAKGGGSTVSIVQARSESEAVEKYRAMHPKREGVWCVLYK
jgi:hypothetical protein